MISTNIGSAVALARWGKNAPGSDEKTRCQVLVLIGTHMPIAVNPVFNNDEWNGFDWVVENENELARLIAYVALGQARYVERILAETNCASLAPAGTTFQGARRLLAFPDTAQRDGWLFQVISWIAAHVSNGTSIIRSPQSRPADKGFDGIQIEYDSSVGAVHRVVICEDKATKNPRKMVLEEVWPSFEDLESGARDHELVQEVTALLERASEIDVDEAVIQIQWNSARSYRVAVTIDDRYDSPEGRKRLFDGFPRVVAGEVGRRRVGTFRLQDLRPDLESLAARALTHLEEMERLGRV